MVKFEIKLNGYPLAPGPMFHVVIPIPIVFIVILYKCIVCIMHKFIMIPNSLAPSPHPPMLHSCYGYSSSPLGLLLCMLCIKDELSVFALNKIKSGLRFSIATLLAMYVGKGHCLCPPVLHSSCRRSSAPLKLCTF